MNDSTTLPQPTARNALWPRLAWLGLLLLAFALRLYQLPAQSLWYDEGVSWYLTRMSLPALTLWTADDIQPPLYYYLLWLWTRLAGTGEYALRFPSAVFGMLTVPLIGIIARRLLGRLAAGLAALLLALSPLHVYYAQEARMYTLLACLGLLSSYLLLRILDGATARVRPYVYPWAYVLAAVGALYTHYFAFFLLLAHALYVAYTGWQRIRASHPLKLGPIISVSIAISLLYLPWLPFLLTRYGVDTSYWPGALKLGEVARKLFIAFSLGETVSEGVGIWLVGGYGLLLLISLAWLVSNIHNTHYEPDTPYLALRKNSPVFLMLYLAVPVALVLLLVARTPKFNPRYAMLASPAFILLIAGGISSILAQHTTHNPQFAIHHSHRRSRFTLPPKGTYGHASRLFAAVALLYMLATSAYSLYNWFQPYRLNQFNKADFRITARIVRERIRPDETVLLSSGHMFPAWAYYYGWQGWQRLPDIEILDVNAALDLSVGDALDRLLHGKQGAWLVRWQNQVTDPFDVLPLYLGSLGTQDDYGQFWHMELLHYTLPAAARFDLASFITQPSDANFDHQVLLLGMRQIARDEIVLVWQAVDRIQADYSIFVHLLDSGGAPLVNADHLPARPMREWRPGQVIPDLVTLALPDELPPGTYQVEVGVYRASEPGLPRLPLADGSGDRALLPIYLEAAALE